MWLSRSKVLVVVWEYQSMDFKAKPERHTMIVTLLCTADGRASVK